MSAKQNIIELVDIHKAFGSQQVLKGVNLNIPRGQTTVIIGRSGGGKSVMLKHMIGLIKPDQGQVLVEGQDIVHMGDHGLNQVRRRFGMLFQDAALFDSMNVRDNVAFPLREHSKLSEGEIKQVVAEKLSMVGLSGVEHKLPSELSGGMRKRVGLARAITLEPEIILFDEPTTGLDPPLSAAINRLIKDTQERLGITAVVISHDIEGAYEVGHNIAMLYLGEIIAQGSPDEIRDSGSEVVQQFVHGRAEGPIEVI
ncbi:MAG: ABC transporter ATP-binding protein [Desulfarculaceae bacterium]|nr:ABC transporter ATP-binding protein [Desulfarculaceae bacterium]MCF8072783.1 ABC transporter ATP-binding protein [Desulfarculaceae bacterium]MCF8100951.1 ABC transporter ATP-binding protein [Desulfarculaceae bacterium]MCF8117565.1 ABC transporter ATP-binding protein [Desulfarculaceae bacterium]